MVVVDQEGPSDIEETVAQKLEVEGVGDHVGMDVEGQEGPRSVDELQYRQILGDWNNSDRKNVFVMWHWPARTNQYRHTESSFQRLNRGISEEGTLAHRSLDTGDKDLHIEQVVGVQHGPRDEVVDVVGGATIESEKTSVQLFHCDKLSWYAAYLL